MSQLSQHHEPVVKGSEVFVRGLLPTVTESRIHEVFSYCGKIVEIRLIKDQKGSVKDFCFVRFATKEAAEKAVKERSGYVLDGKKIDVLASTEQDTLYVGNLNKGWSSYEFDGIVRQVFPDVISVDLATPGGETHSGMQRNRGFAFVKFSSHAAAARAFRVGSKPDFILGGNLHPSIQWAEERHEIDPAELAKIKIAFIRNLPMSADENYLKNLFEPFGEIEKVVISRKGISPVGYVHFTTRLDLDNAIRVMNGKTVQWPKGGPTYKLSVEVARPMDKSRKRAREDSQDKVEPSHLLKNTRSVNTGSPFSSGHTSSAQKEEEYKDSYEAAVLSLPVSVKERLLRILRLGIATRFDIDIHNLTSLKQLPEPTAISVLDQFMLSAADIDSKGVYLAGLISRHQVDQRFLGQSLSGLSKVGELTKRDVAVNSFSSIVHFPADDSLIPRVGSSRTSFPSSFPSQVHLPVVDSRTSPAQLLVPRSDNYVRHSTVSSVSDYPILTRGSLGRIEKDAEVSDYPVFTRGLFGRIKETSCSPLRSASTSSTSYERLKLNPQISEVADRPPTRPQVRFDPFTGEPYKFDPFTGEPILPDNLPNRF